MYAPWPGRSHRGQALFERIIKLAIILMLLGIITSALGAIVRHTKGRYAKYQMIIIRMALDEYRTEFGKYPPSDLLPASMGGGAPLGATAGEKGSEILFGYLCLPVKRKDISAAAPFIENGSVQVDNSCIKSPLGGFYAYINAKHKVIPSGIVYPPGTSKTPEGFLLVDEGSDKTLGTDDDIRSEKLH